MSYKKPPFIYKKNWRKLVICRAEYNNSAMQDFLQNPDFFLDHKCEKFLKNNPGDTTTVGIINLNKQAFVVKRYNVKGFWHGVKLWLRSSRAMISWENAQLLQALQIPSIEPVAVIENRLGPLRSEAYFISKYVSGISCSDYFLQYANFPENYTQVMQAIVRILSQLKSAYIAHDDFHHSNILVAEDKPLLLDLDHMHRYRIFKCLFRRAHEKDVQQFKEYLGGDIRARELFEKLIHH